MPALARRTRVILALAVAVATFVAWQGLAAAALTVTNATLNGKASTSGPPGAVFDARVTATLTEGTNWEGTQ